MRKTWNHAPLFRYHSTLQRTFAKGPTMDTKTLVAGLDFSRTRLLNTLDAIEKACREKNVDVQQVLAWRPGPGRAHIAWQAMHCGATHDKYLNVSVHGKPQANDPALVANFAGGSTPSDQNVPTLAAIRDSLRGPFEAFKQYVANLDAKGLERVMPGPNNTTRSLAEVITLLTWHEAHHQGQIHLTWNLYKAAHGL
jgi:hypothetical protein